MDPATRGVEIALSLSLLDPAEAAFWSQGVSLLLIGILIFSSVRGIIVQVTLTPPMPAPAPSRSLTVSSHVRHR